MEQFKHLWLLSFVLFRRFNAFVDWNQMMWDVEQNTLTPTRVSEAIDLSNLTRITEVMQVKYGSRWIALILESVNENGLIDDPREFAKELYGKNMLRNLHEKVNMIINCCYINRFKTMAIVRESKEIWIAG